MVAKCVIFIHLSGSICQHKVVDFPRERLSQEPPLTCCGIDMFGPILGKGRSQRNEKIWVFLYMYFTSRAIRIESTNSLSGDAFIQTLQRIVSRRADIWVNTTKNDTNFVGDSAELNKGFSEINHKKIN